MQLLAPPLPARRRTAVIYVRRSPQTGKLALLNDEALLARLSDVVDAVGRGSLRFVVHDDMAPALTARHEVALYQQAAVVIGPHGDGFANVMWCGPGTAVLEFPAGGKIAKATFSVSRALLHLGKPAIPDAVCRTPDAGEGHCNL